MPVFHSDKIPSVDRDDTPILPDKRKNSSLRGASLIHLQEDLMPDSFDTLSDEGRMKVERLLMSYKGRIKPDEFAKVTPVSFELRDPDYIYMADHRHHSLEKTTVINNQIKEWLAQGKIRPSTSEFSSNKKMEEYGIQLPCGNAKAFSSVSQEHVAKAMEEWELPNTIKHYTNNAMKQTQAVYYDKGTAHLKEVTSGVVQGDPMSSIIFAITLSKEMKECEKRVQVSEPRPREPHIDAAKKFGYDIMKLGLHMNISKTKLIALNEKAKKGSSWYWKTKEESIPPTSALLSKEEVGASNSTSLFLNSASSISLEIVLVSVTSCSVTKAGDRKVDAIESSSSAMMLACARELLSEGWGKESCWCLCHQINLLMDDLLKYWYSSAKSFVISVAKALKYKERNVHEKGLKMVHVCWTRWIDRLRTIKMLVDERKSYRELLEDIGTLEADQALQFFQNPGFINPMIDFVRDYFLYFERAILAAEGNCIVSMERSVVALISHVRDLEVEDEPTPNVKERLERIENSLEKYKQAMIIHPLGKIEEEEKYVKLLEQHGCPEAKEFIQFDVCALITKKKTLAIMVDKYERMIKAAELTDKGEEKKRQKEIKLIHSKIETIAATFFDEKKFDIIRGVCLKVLSVPCSGADVERFFSRFSFIYSPQRESLETSNAFVLSALMFNLN
ncbi:hypothetical protein ADUPG1_012915 [Aduncisulcus paluster]|uniref:HAT C-terminal dimerisation domain-containing protein n=1 Tax=Aduncisulcus paluster TaxID=2918883 RepID=A0ABQ5K351_9EUKA|nr:hypothetical protein ADUPG1_012915 [Aduncisulcus paluster]